MSCKLVPNLAITITSSHPAFHPHSSVANTTSLLRWLAFNRKPRFCVFSFAPQTAALLPTQEQLPHVSCKYSPHLLTCQGGFAWWGHELSQPFKWCCSVIQGVPAPQPGGVTLMFWLAKQPQAAARAGRRPWASLYLPTQVLAGHAPA